MKYLIATITILIIVTSAFAQIEKPEFKKNNCYKAYKSKGEIIVLDSTIHFSSIYGIERNKVLTRDKNGNVTKAILHTFNDASQTWINKNIITIEYYDTGKINKYIEKPWNSNTLKWEDTCSYIEYDINGKLLVEYRKFWNYYYNRFGSGEKRCSKYNNEGNIMSFIKYRRNRDTQEWQKETQEIYTYENNNLIQHTHKGWNPLSTEWENIANYTYSYDAFGNKIQFTRQLWNSKMSSWKNHIQYFYSYNQNKNKIEELWQFWNDDIEEWYSPLKKSYIYDISEELISEFVEQWNFETEKWDNQAFSTFTFDDNGNQTLMLNQGWNNDLESWVGVYNHITKYDDNGNKTLDINQLWDDSEEIWNNTSQEIFAYDENNNLIQHTKQNWNIRDESWENFSQESNDYDANSNIVQYADYYWDIDINEWGIHDKYDYFWSEYQITNISDINSVDFKLYPNPATSKITILSDINQTIDNVEILSVSGKLIKTVSLRNNEINIEGLKNGMFLLNIKFNKSQTIKSFIKR